MADHPRRRGGTTALEPLARGVLGGEYEEGDRITVDHDGSEFTFTHRPGASAPEVVEAEVASGV